MEISNNKLRLSFVLNVGIYQGQLCDICLAVCMYIHTIPSLIHIYMDNYII